MVLVRLLLISGLFVGVIGYRCHVVDNKTVLHCDASQGVKCPNVRYGPYCERVPGDTSSMNGLCTCEKWCLIDADCTGGCRASFKSVCHEAYSGSFEKYCLCEPTATIG